MSKDEMRRVVEALSPQHPALFSDESHINHRLASFCRIQPLLPVAVS